LSQNEERLSPKRVRANPRFSKLFTNAAEGEAIVTPHSLSDNNAGPEAVDT